MGRPWRPGPSPVCVTTPHIHRADCTAHSLLQSATKTSMRVAHSRPACLRTSAVFVSSDIRTGGAYVPPFGDVIRWERISLHLAPSQVTPHLMRILAALPDE